MTKHDPWGVDDFDMRAWPRDEVDDDSHAGFRPTFWEVMVPLALGGVLARVSCIILLVLWRHGMLATLTLTGGILWLSAALVTGATLLLLGVSFALVRIFPPRRREGTRTVAQAPEGVAEALGQ